MSYSEEEILKSSEDSGWNSSGTWNHYGSENYYTNRSSHPEYSTSWATYATLTKPSLPLKPQRKATTADSFTSGSSGIDSTGGYSLQQQQQFSKSQHHLNYASNHHPNHHHSSRHSSRRFSEDETTYLSTSTGSPSSFTHNVHPANIQRITHKPLPPAKPPRNSISSKSYTSSSSSSKSSQVRQEFTQAWHKSIDLDHTLPPPEGYGNIRRSASNDVEGFASSFRHSNASNTTNNHLEYSIVPCDTSLVDQFLTNHLYDEIGVHRQSRQKQQQQPQPQPQPQTQPQPQNSSMTSSSLSNDNLDHNRSYNHEVNLSSFTSNRLSDQLHRSRQHSSWNYSSSNAQYHQQMQEVRAAIQAEVQKHVRSRSTHHPRYISDEQQQQQQQQQHHHQNQYETPNRVRESSLDRTNSAWNNKRPLHQLQPTSVQSSKAPPPASSSSSCSRTVEQTDRNILKPRAITDQYATVMHPPPPEVALKSIRAVIKPLHQEHKKRKRKKSTSTTIEDHLFATIDQNGKKVTVKAKTLDKIPLLKDKSVMTDPVPDELFAQSENPFAVLSRTSKVTCEDGKRSLRRTKHHQFIHVGTAERRKKKFSLTQVAADKRKEIRATRDSTSNENVVVEIVQPEPIIVIKPIEIEEPKTSQPVAKTLSPFDRKEWEEIETLMASFESTFKRSPLPLSDPESNNRTASSNGTVDKEKTPEKGVIHASLLRNKGNKSPLAPLSPGLDGVKNFLFSLDLPDYTPLLMANGFDDVRFMGPNVMEASDLHEIGIKNEQHVTKIITSARKLFPKLDLLEKKVEVTVEEWLKALHLEEYLDKFLENGFDDMSRVRKIWEVELQAVLEINKVGHRKRILANLGERLSLMTDLGLDELDFSSVVESCMRARSKTPETSGRKSVSSQRSPQPVSIVETATGKKGESVKEQQPEKQFLANIKNGPGRERTFSPENVSVDTIELGCKSSNSALSLTIASVPQWKHDPKQLVQQRVSYTAFYLGSTLVRQLLGIESTRESIKKLKETTKDQPKIPVVVLSISYTGVQFIDGQLNQIVCEHEIRNIHCACQDTDDFKHFAYITKDHESSNHYCHVFAALNLDLATEVILTLGQAFEVAYQLALGTDINELSKIYLQVKETQLLKADSASTTNKELSRQQKHQLQRDEAEKDDSCHNELTTGFNGERNNSKDEPVPWPRKNLVMEQLKQIESVSSENGKDQRGLNGCKGSRIRSKSTEGVVGALSKSFEDSSKNRIGNNYNNNNNNKCTSTSVTTSSKSNEQVKLQPSVNNKAKPIPPAKPASLVRFPVSPAGTLGRVRRSDAF